MTKLNTTELIQVASLIGEITALTSLISATTKADAFARFSGHVHSFNVDVYAGGWERGSTDYVGDEVYTNKERSLGELEQMRDKLVEILNAGGKINYDELPYNLVQVKEYCLAGRELQ